MTDEVEIPILFDRDGPIARLRMNCPGSLNALTPRMADGLLDGLRAVAADTDIAVLVLEGVGRSFMAGGDLQYLAKATPEQAHQEAGALIDQLNAIVSVFHDFPVPTLAVVHGAVAGAGLSLMLAADFVLAAEGSCFVYAYANIGASPDGGLSSALVGAIGLRRTMRFAFIDKQMGTNEASAQGLIDWVAPAETLPARAREVAQELAALPRHAFHATRGLLRDAATTPAPVMRERERAGFQACTQTADLREGVAAFFERRRPSFARSGQAYAL